MQYISLKSLISRTSREFPKVNNKKATQFFWNGQQDLNKHFTEDDVQMANKHTKFSTLLFLRKMQITIITKYTTHSVERIKLTKSWQECEATRIIIFWWWPCESVQTHEKRWWFSYKIKHTATVQPSNPTFVYWPKRSENVISTKRHVRECSYKLYSSSSNTESPQMSINSKIDNQILIDSYFAMVLGNFKKN